MRALAAFALALAALPGCSDTMSEADCRAIADNLREAWVAQTKDVKAPEGPNTDKATGVIKSEGEKLVSGWAAECRSKLVDQKISADEMKCLKSGKTLEELRRCSAKR